MRWPQKRHPCLCVASRCFKWSAWLAASASAAAPSFVCSRCCHWSLISRWMPLHEFRWLSHLKCRSLKCESHLRISSFHSKLDDEHLHWLLKGILFLRLLHSTWYSGKKHSPYAHNTITIANGNRVAFLDTLYPSRVCCQSSSPPYIHIESLHQVSGVLMWLICGSGSHVFHRFGYTCMLWVW